MPLTRLQRISQEMVVDLPAIGEALGELTCRRILRGNLVFEKLPSPGGRD
jgi:hypothetical protein